MKAEEVAVLGENNVLLMLVAKDLAELLEVLRAADALCEALLVGLGDRGPDDEVEEGAGAVVEPLDDRLWEEGDNEGEEGLEGDEECADDDGDVVSGGDAAEERETGHRRGRVG